MMRRSHQSPGCQGNGTGQKTHSQCSLLKMPAQATTRPFETKAARPKRVWAPLPRLLARLGSVLEPKANRTSISSSSSTTYEDARTRSERMKAPMRFKFYVTPGGAPQFSILKRFNSYSCVWDWFVSRVLTAEAWNLGGLRPGDVLESIDGESVRGLDDDDVVCMLNLAPQGSVLRFRANQSYAMCYSSHVHMAVGKQKLGVLVIADGLDRIPVVFDVVPASGVIAQLGDALVAINGHPIAGIAWEKVMSVLQHIRPLMLTFQRWNHSRCNWKCQFTASLPRQLTVTSRGSTNSSFSTFSAPKSEEPAPTINSEGKVLIVWRYGPLGLTLMEDPASEMPVVNRLTGKGTASGLGRIQHGFRLTTINGFTTIGRSFRQVCRELSQGRKPASLVFIPPHLQRSSYDTRVSQVDTLADESFSSSLTSNRSSTSSGDDICTDDGSSADSSVASERAHNPLQPTPFTIMWAGGRLGLTMRCRKVRGFGEDPPRTVIFVKRVRPGPAYPAKRVFPGDELVTVNGKPLRPDQSFEETMHLLESLRKPVVLGFLRPTRLT